MCDDGDFLLLRAFYECIYCSSHHIDLQLLYIKLRNIMVVLIKQYKLINKI